MYFDSWSTSYFFWVIICFAVWGMAGFSVYGAINVFTTRKNKYKKEDPLTPERIQELKWKAEQDAELFARKDAKQRLYEKEKEATVKSLEAFVNRPKKIVEEKEEVKATENVGWQKEEFSSESLETESIKESNEEKKEPDHEKLKEIYEKEIKKAQETVSEILEVEPEEQKIDEAEFFVEEPLKEEVSKIEEKAEDKEKLPWQELDDVVRAAFRS